MEKCFANVAIYDARTRELIHFERVWSDYGPEYAVHEEAAKLYRFFAEGTSVFSRVEVYFVDQVQHWTRTADDATFVKQWEYTR